MVVDVVVVVAGARDRGGRRGPPGSATSTCGARWQRPDRVLWLRWQGEFAALEAFASKKVATTLTATAAQIGEEFGVETLRLQADLTEPLQVERIMAEVMAKWGRIDILVNNAGGDIAKACECATEQSIVSGCRIILV